MAGPDRGLEPPPWLTRVRGLHVARVPEKHSRSRVRQAFPAADGEL
jgi:hypothetical protein